MSTAQSPTVRDNLPADVMNPACPSRTVLARMGERWTPLVVEALDAGPLRFTQVRATVGGVTPKVLTHTLRLMEQDGLVARRVYAEVPPRVEYELTALGRSLREPVRAARRWAETHVGDVLEARDAWDQGHSSQAPA
ncbi:DNA-binding transcriptional regulator, HxlR family [Propionibacterium cyclohexanicum]|uniref:DNA-binding transcriptional regulator, HxlR family n=1 Tax=Propionibacterium cyclohexanicum TaxID=64702 RepID=A0A1H9RYJ1_9ACTN|nr:helix-turn-helix domain-containing protein [Propionibacterium cyclohexanicum]SER77734.1 DNA-binding transcriptional regulator, HxlR family [Propionibacterium cyclohexanicum]